MKRVIFAFSVAFVMILYAFLMTYKFFFPLFLQLHDVYNDSEAAEMTGDNTIIDEMYGISYNIDREIVNISRNKRKFEKVDKQVSEVISDLVDKVEQTPTEKTL